MYRRPCLAASAILTYLLLSPCALPGNERAEASRKVVVIAGKKSHGPEGNRIHDYPWSARLLKVALDNSNIASQLKVEFHLDGWPRDPRTLDDADTIMVISDGRDGDKFVEAPHLRDPLKTAWIEKQMKRGCGFLTFHFSTFAPDSQAKRILNWSGGYFDWETDGKRQWYSAIKTMDAKVELPTANHPVCRGVEPFQLRDEYYYNIRFAREDPQLRPIMQVPALPGREPDGRVVAWAREREDGGRGFGTTCGHFYDNWMNDAFRKLILNAIAWTAKAEIPAGGVSSSFYTHDQISRALAVTEQGGSSELSEKPLKALIVTGHQYPGHKWQLTTPVLRTALMRDARIQVNVTENVEDLALEKIREFDLLVLNYCNWQKPGLSDEAKAGFVRYLSGGGGLILIHFANGAFHFSLPEAGESDWPEYRKICRRVWDHSEGKSGHDAYGTFQVQVADKRHPITDGLAAFETIDELYYRQQGDLPIHVLLSAKSKITGQDEPMAFVYEYGQGRVMQTVLGHADESLRVESVQELIVRSAAWVARRPNRKPKPAKSDSGAAELVPDELYVLQPAPQQEQVSERPGRLPKEVRDRLAAGVILNLAAPSDEVPVDARASRLAAIYVKPGEVVSPLLAPGPFQAHWTGYIKARLAGEFRFQIQGTGAATLKLNQQTVLQESGDEAVVALHKGYNTLELSFESDGSGSAQLMLLWASDEFAMEAVPPTVLWHDTAHELLERATQLRAGRQLFAQSQCRACHADPVDVDLTGGGMPELARQAPSLEGIGSRLRPAWIRKWIEDPASLRAHATMPGLFSKMSESDRKKAIADVVAYCLTMVDPEYVPREVNIGPEQVEAGEILFEDLGCIACHRLSDPREDDYFKRISLRMVGQKMQPGALVLFLQNPRRHFPWSRMPDFRLSEGEAVALATYLRAKSVPTEDVISDPGGDPQRGRSLVQSLGCANCHQFSEERASVKKRPSPFAAKSAVGCLHPEPQGAAPVYRWTSEERQALIAFVQTSGESLGQRSEVEAASRFVRDLNCIACHRRDDRYADWPETLFEDGVQGHPPENVPAISWAGEKLRQQWMRDLFAGQLPYKTRPWLTARMPTFPARGDTLAAGIAAEHGFGPADVERTAADSETLSIAERLTRKDGGLDCRQCHAMADEILKMENQAYGVSFGYIRHRLRYDYYQRWMLNPLRYDPATKMPRYSPDRQTTAIKHVYEGDAKRQFDALWQYLDTTRVPVGKQLPVEP